MGVPVAGCPGSRSPCGTPVPVVGRLLGRRHARATEVRLRTPARGSNVGRGGVHTRTVARYAQWCRRPRRNRRAAIQARWKRQSMLKTSVYCGAVGLAVITLVGTVTDASATPANTGGVHLQLAERPNTVRANGLAYYSVRVRNGGPATATSVDVSVALRIAKSNLGRASNVTWESSSCQAGGGIGAGGNQNCTVGRLLPGQLKTFYFTVRAPARGGLTGQASTSGFASGASFMVSTPRIFNRVH